MTKRIKIEHLTITNRKEGSNTAMQEQQNTRHTENKSKIRDLTFSLSAIIKVNGNPIKRQMWQIKF